VALVSKDFAIKPSDGWTLVVTNPAYLSIRVRAGTPWQLAVTASGLPTSETSILVFDSYSQSDGNDFSKDTVSNGLFYIRTLIDGANGEPLFFGVLFDDAPPPPSSITVDITTITVDSTTVTSDAT